MWFLAIFVVMASAGYAECRELPSVINESMTLCSETYDVTEGVVMSADNVVLDCGTAILRNTRQGRGIVAENRKSITIQNCNLVMFATGIYFRNVSRAMVTRTNFVKNDIAMMLEDSYENWIAGNTDKSLQTPVVIVQGKFNTFQFDNKRVEGSLCDGNVCNSQDTLNPCVSFDGYCSSVCSAASDEDCKIPVAVSGKTVTEVKVDAGESKRLAAAVENIQKIEESIRNELPQQASVTPVQRNVSVIPMIIIAAVLVGFSVLVVMKNKGAEDQECKPQQPVKPSVVKPVVVSPALAPSLVKNLPKSK
ncbi:hypothetical protein HY490_01525 [Candidatus Woesearchaeota archaeon]|nr:hypothetical protein [Candidatus Woesearchaeota archaeon]